MSNSPFHVAQANDCGVLPRRDSKPEDVKWLTPFENHYWGQVCKYSEDANSLIYIDAFFSDVNALRASLSKSRARSRRVSTTNSRPRWTTSSDSRRTRPPRRARWSCRPSSATSAVTWRVATTGVPPNCITTSLGGGPGPHGFGAVLYIDITAGTTTVVACWPDQVKGRAVSFPPFGGRAGG
ncbi:hypothetical protein CORC01_10520 [Colletotrichum orchidophilum]|uniref:Uncharacterized protein n=1 Tax=Colletotrichum orchidophilum TaxID=1209926 RepID=A0A1G4AYR8_9PEZI|nr:uncharacterized protein CORC01_10520 [Colletotrichum orchidophilum]OHE94182.1 hypothetical protein CORC01_10520 [Colletotrichum orchidophilum]